MSKIYEARQAVNLACAFDEVKESFSTAIEWHKKVARNIAAMRALEGYEQMVQINEHKLVDSLEKFCFDAVENNPLKGQE